MTYYDRPLLKEPVWEIDIPIYYYLGGAAGAALVLAAAAQFDGAPGLGPFVRRCQSIGIIGCSAGGALLIHDLGRPSRFLNMLRVFRPTSPMNMGAWILSGTAPLAIAARLLPGAMSQAAGYGAGFLGLGLAGYTGVLLSNTAIPVYQNSRRLLPVLFLASAAATAASILDVMNEEPRATRITFAFGTAGRLAELAAGSSMPISGTLWRAATVLTALSLVVSVIPGQSRSRRRWAGVLGAAGSLCLRIAVHYAGKASVRADEIKTSTYSKIAATGPVVDS